MQDKFNGEAERCFFCTVSIEPGEGGRGGKSKLLVLASWLGGLGPGAVGIFGAARERGAAKVAKPIECGVAGNSARTRAGEHLGMVDG